MQNSQPRANNTIKLIGEHTQYEQKKSRDGSVV